MCLIISLVGFGQGLRLLAAQPLSTGHFFVCAASSNTFKTSKISQTDKMRIQTLREQGLGAKAIRAAYPQKQWKLRTLQDNCQRIDKTGSTEERLAADVQNQRDQPKTSPKFKN